MDDKETVILLDEEPAAPVTLSGTVAGLCAAGDHTGALVAIAQAVERIAVAVPAPVADPGLRAIAPQVEAVLRDWGYVPLNDLPAEEASPWSAP